MLKPIEYRGQTFDRTHGSPFDRGSADDVAGAQLHGAEERG